MITIRSFRSKILLALVAVALIPTGLTIVSGTVTLREIVSTSGTAGPWQAVAESGRALLEAAEDRAEEDPALARAVERHREALSESARLSRLYALVSDRFLDLLPYFAVGTVVLVGLLSVLTARILSRIFSGPIQELVEWTERIARDEPLPDPATLPPAGVREFEQLRFALRSMADELDEARQRAVEGARLRSWTEMARSVAHELKNPLTPMRMAAGTVAMLEDPRASEAGRVLMEEIDRLDEMARSFSRLGRMPEGPKAEVEIAELLSEVVAPYEEGGVDIRVDVQPGIPRVRGWYEPLLRIFRNLVGNAFEAVREAASEERGWIRITVRSLDDVDEGAISVSVRDSGPGIPPENIDSIWDPDFTTRPQGTGLGLTLVRQAVEAHRGRVRAQNLDGAGAEFEVVLPVGAEQHAEASPARAPAR